ncbi:MAG: aminomethyl-transferring glycine dehydrogenase subunit GcvPA [Candidatus Bipolaricaulota bacterium]|nr:aminomethyl-transferring glycine dehydrogenase subunit GcvPA [Candidatus Bipolaricaulota bacterium]
MHYIPNTDADRKAMLAAIGRSSAEELFADIPQIVKDRFQPLGLSPKNEMEVRTELGSLAQENEATNAISFLGGGIYDHYIPSIVQHITSRSEFYTAYTPYQPEIAQGTLTAMFEFQTFLCELTGMEAANSSMYDGGTALAEAAMMATRVTGIRKIAVSHALFAHYRRVLDTYCWASGIEIAEIPAPDGHCDFSRVPSGVSSVIVQSPNAFGVIENLVGVKEAIGDALLIVAVNPVSLGILAAPGQSEADIVTGEGQPFGLPASFGGPFLGLFATRKAYLRQMPGRLVGQTVDADGNIGYTMAAQTREQHIRRGKATSNICTNAQLCALTATVYLASLGGDGLRDLAVLNLEKAHYLADRLSALPGCSLEFAAPFFNEFVLRVPGDPQKIRAGLRKEGILIDDPAHMEALGITGALRLAVTERRSKNDLDLVADLVGRML